MKRVTSQWIPTYSDYIRKYILDFKSGPKDKRKHIPGEHHFVSTYLVPRLMSFTFLKEPTYVNPDGMKAIPGDIVYYDREETDGTVNWNYRLGIEVKIGSMKFSRTEYYDWMKTASSKKPKPHLFIAIARQGIMIGRWGIFSKRYLKIAFHKSTKLPAIPSGGYTPSRDFPKVLCDSQHFLQAEERPLPDGLQWWEFAEKQGLARQNESEFMDYLERECRHCIPARKK